MTNGGEPGDITHRPEDGRCSDWSDPPNVTETGPRSHYRGADPFLGRSHLGLEPGNVVDEFGAAECPWLDWLLIQMELRDGNQTVLPGVDRFIGVGRRRLRRFR